MRKHFLNVLKLMGKHFIHPKSSEIMSIFQVFPCTTQIALFWPKLLPALFLKKPG
jgi:formate hydrogenlyase subunit 4